VNSTLPVHLQGDISGSSGVYFFDRQILHFLDSAPSAAERAEAAMDLASLALFYSTSLHSRYLVLPMRRMSCSSKSVHPRINLQIWSRYSLIGKVMPTYFILFSIWQCRTKFEALVSVGDSLVVDASGQD
jgi:hypothetical protein